MLPKENEIWTVKTNTGRVWVFKSNRIMGYESYTEHKGAVCIYCGDNKAFHFHVLRNKGYRICSDSSFEYLRPANENEKAIFNRMI